MCIRDRFITFGKRGLHFGRCVGGVKLQGIPFLVYPFTPCVQGEIGLAECFAYAYTFLHLSLIHIFAPTTGNGGRNGGLLFLESEYEILYTFV